MKRRIFLMMTTAVLCFATCGICLAETPTKILILPFNVYSEKDLSFLKNGIMDMLSTRLFKEGETVPVDKKTALELMAGIKEATPGIADDLGKKVNAGYVVFGSLTFFGDSISTDAKVYDTASERIVHTFNETGRDNGDVIAHINKFAAEVNETVFGRQRMSAAPPAVSSGAEDLSRKHPETLWTGKVESERRQEGTEADGVEGNLGAVWRSRNFKTDIRGMSLGDVDGDGKIEMAFIDETEVHVYRYADDRFLKIGAIKGDPNDRLIGVDVADINNNGKAEIFVTNIHTGNNATRSFVLEWNGTGFEKILEDSRWYFRVLNLPGRRPMLIGQTGGVGRIFLPGVDELIWAGDRYTTGTPLDLPSWVNVFAFTYGNLRNDGRENIVAFTKEDYLKVLDSEGNAEWESSDPYGGSNIYMEYPMEASASIGEHKEMSRYYVPVRILVSDTDNDGKNEIFVGKNTDAAKRLFSRLRLFKGGHIECMQWDNFGLYSEWRTREISGYISDYAIGDIDNDGEPELAFSVIQRTSSVIGDAKSFLAAYDFK